MTPNVTPNRRVQRILDCAEANGWQVAKPNADDTMWVVFPGHVYSEGFVVHGLPNDAAKVLRADTYKPVGQKEAMRLIETRAADRTHPLDQVDVDVHTIKVENGHIAVESGFLIPDSLGGSDRAEFCEGALLAASKIAGLIEGLSNGTAEQLASMPESVRESSYITPPHAAHAWLSMTAQLRDPNTLRIILKERDEPSDALLRGVGIIVTSLIGVWTAFADALFSIDPEQGCPVSEFLNGLVEHAEFLRQAADDTFGDGLTATDAEFESLLS